MYVILHNFSLKCDFDIHIVFDLSGESSDTITLTWSTSPHSYTDTVDGLARSFSTARGTHRTQYYYSQHSTHSLCFKLRQEIHTHSVFCIYPPFKKLVTFHKGQPIAVRLLLGQWKVFSQSRGCSAWRQPIECKPY